LKKPAIQHPVTVVAMSGQTGYTVGQTVLSPWQVLGESLAAKVLKKLQECQHHGVEVWNHGATFVDGTNRRRGVHHEENATPAEGRRPLSDSK